MRKGILLALGIWTLALAPLSAQQAYVPPTPPPASFPSEGVGPPAPPPMPAPPMPQFQADPGVMMPAPIVYRPVYDPEAYRVWMRADLLVWWVKNAPTPITVVASNDLVNNPNGTPLGNSVGDYGAMSGFRFVIGGWLENSHNIGIEATFFSTESRSNNFSANSDANGNPMLAFPFINQTPGSVGPAIMPITIPGKFSGDINVGTSMSLWGTELNGVFSLLRTSGGFEWTVLGGFRYLDLIEHLNIQTDSQSLADNTLTSFYDNFDTRNQFYGGQLGTRITWHNDRLSFDVTAKLALGVNHETVNVQGATVQYPGNSFTPNIYPGGFFAQSSNIGQSSANQFAVIPSVELKLSYAVSPRCRIYAGYDFMYWNQVVRPGNQVDHNINLSQSAILGTGVLSGQASPAPLFNRTDFWAQGITLGVEFRF